MSLYDISINGIYSFQGLEEGSAFTHLFSNHWKFLSYDPPPCYIAVMKKLLPLVLLALIILPVVPVSGGAIEAAFQQRKSNVQVQGSGTVIRILSDDNQGSRHQRFILKLASGQTLLIAHNIDVAPRINGLAKGDRVDFCGEYEWNNKGGVIHWTHRDPNGRHPGGWLKYRGKTYQ